MKESLGKVKDWIGTPSTLWIENVIFFDSYLKVKGDKPE